MMQARRENREKEKQQLISNTIQSTASTSATSKKSQFSTDLCQAFVSANIPIWKLTNSNLRNFLEKYTNETIPSESTIRKNYVGDCYEETMKRIHQDLENELNSVSTVH